MPGPHPTDRNLAALIDGLLSGDSAEQVRSHVRDCPRCQLRIGASGEGLLGDDQSATTEPVPVVILQESVVDLPAPGDVWRLTWDAANILSVIWRVDPDRISVLPILDTADADEWSALLDLEVTGGLGELAVSVAFETAVPWSVLDARVARLADTEALTSLRIAFRSGTPTATRRGDAVRSPLDERLIGLEELTETLSELANAIWAPMPAAATPMSLDFDALIAAGIAVNRALAIVRGASPDDNEADAIQAITGVRPGPHPVDDELRRTIDQPRRKAKIRARAAGNRRDEGSERLALAQEAQPALAAARGTHGAAPDYDTILDRLLNV